VRWKKPGCIRHWRRTVAGCFRIGARPRRRGKKERCPRGTRVPLRRCPRSGSSRRSGIHSGSGRPRFYSTATR